MEVFGLLKDYWPSLLAFGVFGVLHSVGAQEPFKKALARFTSLFFVEHFWRLAYCALSYIALYYGVDLLHWSSHFENDVWLVAYPEWLWRMLTVVHLGSIVLIYIAFFQSDYLEFLGLRQAWRGILMLFGSPVAQPPLALFGNDRLVVTGVYVWVRHPMMIGGLLFLLTSGPSLNNLVFIALYTTYMVIGGYYEEKRLVRVFGAEYRSYQARVGAFFPRLWHWRRR